MVSTPGCYFRGAHQLSRRSYGARKVNKAHLNNIFGIFYEFSNKYENYLDLKILTPEGKQTTRIIKI